VNADKKSVLAIAACILFYLAYSQYLSTKYPAPTKSAVTDAATPAAPAANTPASAAATSPASTSPSPIPLLSDTERTIANDTVTYRFDSEGGLARVTLKHYQVAVSPKGETGPNVELLDAPMIVTGMTGIDPAARPLMPVSAERNGQTISFTRQLDAVQVKQEYTIPATGYAATLKVIYTNTSSAAVDLTAALYLSERLTYKKQSALMGFIPGTVTDRDAALYSVDGDAEHLDLETFCGDDEPVAVASVPVDYFGIDRHYFLGIFEPQIKKMTLRINHAQADDAGCRLDMFVSEPQGQLAPGASTSFDFEMYFGPKELAQLTQVNPALESTVNLGVFAFIAKPLLEAIEGLKRLTGNYGTAIILLTILLKILFYPLTKASAVSAHAMKKLNPQMQAIREKYKDDRQRQQQELMKFMSGHKINPMKGCLPILPQIPVFFAFYQVLQTSIQLRHAPFYGWIQDLAVMDPYLVTPLLMGVAMFIQQKLTPMTGMDKTQEKILMMMPIIFTVMMLTLPAGMTLYMLTNTVVGIAQQRWLNHKLDKANA
jgi:YidC/Oxa1 family membrane protein insertase